MEKMVRTFEPSKEYELLRKAAREFAKNEIEPISLELCTADYETVHKKVLEIYRKAAPINLTSMSIPQEFGGPGYGTLAVALCLEEIAAADGGIATSIGAHHLGLLPIIISYDENAQAKWFKEVLEGERIGKPKIWAFAITEPNTGSDYEYLEGGDPTIPKLELTVKREGDEYIINGTKRFISNGSIADYVTIFGALDGKRNVNAICCFVVPTNIEGFSIGTIYNKMGQNSSPTAELVFDNVRIPSDNIVGGEEEGFGWLLIQQTLAYSRAPVGAIALGIARSAYEKCLAYAKGRVQGGKPIIQHQNIKLKLARMLMKLQAAELFVFDVCAKLETTYPPPAGLSAMAKVFATDTSLEIATEAIQVMGGDGYMRDMGVEKALRDIRLTQIYEGTNEINLLTVADEL